MASDQAIENLKDALRRLPGVGPRTAGRMAFHRLERDREGGKVIAEALNAAISSVNHCARCNNFSEEEFCGICSSGKRDSSILCVVETPADLDTIEQAGAYTGYYFVLMGHLSPLDGVGPEQLGFDRLLGAECDSAGRGEVRRGWAGLDWARLSGAEWDWAGLGGNRRDGGD